jgi:hypothetical protein
MSLRLLKVALLAGLSLSALAGPQACRVDNIDYLGWKAVRMANAWVTLTIVPQLGGRLMQVTFGGHDYLFVNQQLKGQSFSPELSAAQKRWFNYGGDKIWPMPEGSDDERHWPGAEGALLDSGAFTAQVCPKAKRARCGLPGHPIHPSASNISAISASEWIRR